MGGVLWGCVSALCLGSADFMARFGTRALGARSVYLFVLAVGAAALTVVVVASGAPLVWSPAGYALSALHGLSVVVMSVLLYTALARGPISMVAPIVAAHPVLVLAFAFATGQRPSLAQWLAMAAIVAGVIAVARYARPGPSDAGASRPGLKTATPPEEEHRGDSRGSVVDSRRSRASSPGRESATPSRKEHPERMRVGAACSRQSLAEPVFGESGGGNPRKAGGSGKLHASEDSAARRTTLLIATGASAAYALIIISGQAAVPLMGELQTTWVGRLVGLAALLALFAVRRERPRCERSWLPFLLLLGLLDTSGYLALFAGSTGLHPEATAVAASTFGVVTVVLARVILREPIAWRQWGAIALVFSGVATLAGAGT